jgi:hypothetical protein
MAISLSKARHFSRIFLPDISSFSGVLFSTHKFFGDFSPEAQGCSVVPKKRNQKSPFLFVSSWFCCFLLQDIPFFGMQKMFFFCWFVFLDCATDLRHRQEIQKNCVALVKKSRRNENNAIAHISKTVGV